MEQSAVPVAAVETVGPDAIALVLETPGGFQARPGQFVKLITTVDGEEASRFYTISSPDVAGTFELTIGIDPDGDVSPHLRDLEPGDEVTLSGPYGNAYYEDEASVLVIAGGPGIGPAVGIAERVLDDGGEAAIVYQDDEPLHEDRLAELDERGVSVAVIGSEDGLDGAVEGAIADGQQVFVYGFADFLDAAISAIEAAGGTPDAAKVENFG